MSKISKSFEFAMPLTHKVVRDLKIITEHVGDLIISGAAYCNTHESVISSDRYDVDIDFIKWQGQDIKPVLEVIGDMNECGEAALQHAAYLFADAKEEKQESLFELATRITRAHAKAFYGIDLNKGGGK
jgi:hypothetical protein